MSKHLTTNAAKIAILQQDLKDLQSQLETAHERILELAKDVSYEDVEPLFNTSVKKSGTRIITMITLGVLLKNGLEKNEAINEFINKALEDKNKLLVEEAQQLA